MGEDEISSEAEVEMKRSAGESVSGEISGIVGRRGTFPEAEGRRGSRGGEGNVSSSIGIPAWSAN